MLFKKTSSSILSKVLILFVGNVLILSIVITNGYIHVNTNARNIERIQDYLLPVTKIHAQNFEILQRIMNSFSDATITNDEDILESTRALKEKLLINLQKLKAYNTDVKIYEERFLSYYDYTYEITLNILENTKQLKLENIQLLHQYSKEIVALYKNNRDNSEIVLKKSLTSIANESKVFFDDSLYISTLGLSIMLLLGVFVYYFIQQRFRTVLDSVRNLSQKDPDFSMQVIDNYKDEISQLIKYFHKISDKLENTNEVLKEEVQKAIHKTKIQDQQMVQQSRLALMGEMLSMIAHQWRQPLNAINGVSLSRSIQIEMGNMDAQKEIASHENIMKYVHHLSDTIEDFRGFFKPTQKKSECNYNEIITSVVDLIGESIKNRAIDFEVVQNNTKPLFTYPNEIKQVLLNLIKNAEDALEEKEIENPYIKLVTYEEGKLNILEVRDNAGGIKQEIQDRIFDPYFSTKDESTGTGIGLYMSKMIIEEHCNGKLSIENDDHGAVFKISLETSLG